MSASLSELKILALDCQATGANPQKGHLLELGWMSACASPPQKSRVSRVQAYLNRLPRDEKIPPAVQRITGISDQSLTPAVPSGIIWQHLVKTVGEVISYDRLRILTTELRRLISENRNIELRLRPTVVLGNDELKRALRWV